MTVLIVGGGAVGSFLGWALASGGRDVAIVRRQLAGGPVRADLAVVESAGLSRTANVLEVRDPGELSSAPELILFAVKMYDLDAAIGACAAWPKAPALTVQNGVGAEELVLGQRPATGVIAGSLTTAVERFGPGEIRRLRRGGLGLAPVRGTVDGLVAELGRPFTASGLPVRQFRDPDAMKWSKLLANLIANATAAIVDLDPARIYGHPGLFDIEHRQLREAIAVMGRLGLRPVALPGADARLLSLVTSLPGRLSQEILRRFVGSARGGKDPSLRVQVTAGSGPSEVDWLNGAVARAAARVGIEATVNRRLTGLVTEVLANPDRRAWFRGHPDRLVEAMTDQAG